MIPASLKTNRLRLRQWTDDDLPAFAELNADEEVMRYFPAPLNRAESDSFAERIRAHIATHGWGLWAVEHRDEHTFIGFVGLSPVREELPFSPAMEVGWRLGRRYWGQGYATEAATECLRYGFEQLRADEILSYTAALNKRSIAVMERIGLSYSGQDFSHPALDADHRLSHHVLYGISREA